MQEGSLYPVLYHLLEQGYISDQEVLVGTRMKHIYYHLEPAREVYLRGMIEEYTAVTEGVFQIIHGGKK